METYIQFQNYMIHLMDLYPCVRILFPLSGFSLYGLVTYLTIRDISSIKTGKPKKE